MKYSEMQIALFSGQEKEYNGILDFEDGSRRVRGKFEEIVRAGTEDHNEE